jgi:hypothetical protein
MAGKGDYPRNCFSQKYKDNFSEINWKTDEGQPKPYKIRKGKLRGLYIHKAGSLEGMPGQGKTTR